MAGAAVGTSTGALSMLEQRLTGRMLRILWLSVGGVFLDGYDITIISIGLLLIRPQFHASPVQIGFIAAATLIGNFVGALVFGNIADRIGRRLAFFWDIAFFVVFAAVSAFSQSISQLMLWRFLLGIGIGADYALASPIIAEIVPARIRGRLLTLNWGGAWFLGELAAFIVGALLLPTGPQAWRWMLATGAIPAIVVLIARRAYRESPRWFMTQGRAAEAQEVIALLSEGSPAPAQAAAAEAQSPPAMQKNRLAELFGPRFLKNTLFGMLNYFFEGAPFYALSVFLPTILVGAGYAKTPTGIASGNLILQATGAIGIVICFLLVDTAGRKVCNYVGFGGVALALLVYEFLYPPSLLALFIIFIGVEIAVWAGPACTDNLYLGELWPTRIRATGAGIGAAAGRLSAILGTVGLPVLIASSGLRVALVVPLLFCVGGVIATAWLSPEPKQRTLEDLWGL